LVVREPEVRAAVGGEPAAGGYGVDGHDRPVVTGAGAPVPMVHEISMAALRPMTGD
jgi:hypothetical protein